MPTFGSIAKRDASLRRFKLEVQECFFSHSSDRNFSIKIGAMKKIFGG